MKKKLKWKLANEYSSYYLPKYRDPVKYAYIEGFERAVEMCQLRFELTSLRDFKNIGEQEVSDGDV